MTCLRLFLVPSLSCTLVEEQRISCNGLWQVVNLTEFFFTCLPAFPVAMTRSPLSHLIIPENPEAN